MKAITTISTITLAALLIICMPASGIDFGNPLGKLGMPDPVLDQLGSLMYATKLKSCTRCEREEDVKTLKTVWTKLIQAAPNTPPYKSAKAKGWQWEVTLAEDMGLADAEAFPGGKVIVYSRANALAGKDPEQIAFLLGHEMAHALARHAKARFDKHAQTAIMSAAAGGTLNASKLDPAVTLAAMAAMGVAYEGAAVKPFAKKLEFEADRNALILMAQAGYNPRAAVKYLEKYIEPLPNLKHSFLADHPPVKDRIANLETHLKGADKIYQKTKG
jgi:predicted Zn-dependent protease